jgi:putative membrane protein
MDRQREHQANERTFLAWLRTSISLIGFGFAIARFGLFLQEFQSANESNASAANSQLLGLGLVVSGVAVIVLAGWRYNQVFHQIERGAYRPSRWTIWVLTVLVTFLGLLSIPLLQGQRSPSNASKSSIRRIGQRIIP